MARSFHRPILPFLLAAMACMMACIAASTAHAQAPKDSPEGDKALTVQLVDSRKGYVARVPGEAILDSNASGWSPKGLYEVRVYRLPGIGTIRFTATIKTMDLPANAVTNGTYTYVDADSATERGNARIRTFYLPTRHVKIEMIPASVRMARYIEKSEIIFGSFRWKPKANTEAVNTD